MGEGEKRGREAAGFRFYTTEDVAEMLGLNRRTVQKWIKDGKLASHRFGTEYRVEEQDLQEFIRASRHTPGVVPGRKRGRSAGNTP